MFSFTDTRSDARKNRNNSCLLSSPSMFSSCTAQWARRTHTQHTNTKVREQHGGEAGVVTRAPANRNLSRSCRDPRCSTCTPCKYSLNPITPLQSRSSWRPNNGCEQPRTHPPRPPTSTWTYHGEDTLAEEVILHTQRGRATPKRLQVWTPTHRRSRVTMCCTLHSAQRVRKHNIPRP